MTALSAKASPPLQPARARGRPSPRRGYTAPASLFAPPPDPAAPPTRGNWITTTPDGYFAGSANLAPFIRWNVDGVLYPAAAYWDVYYRPDLVQQALKVPGG